MDNSDSYIEIGATEKLRYAVEAKRINDELMEHLANSLTWVLHYCTKNDLPLPNREKIDQIVDIAIRLTNPRSTETLHQKNQPQNGQSHD